jgi:Fur family ferric uptake transcriptional regulator
MQNDNFLNQRIRAQFLDMLKDLEVSIAGSLITGFFSDDTHVTASGLKEKLRRNGVDVGLNEVRHALRTFAEYGFAKEVKFEGLEEPAYEHSHLGEHHDHFICTRCGKVHEFQDSEIESLQERDAREFGFYPLHHKMEIYGLCRDCRPGGVREMALSVVPSGARIRIASFQGGRGLQERLSAMGLTFGETAEVLSSERGPVILAVRTTRLAIGRGMAGKIMVVVE